MQEELKQPSTKIPPLAPIESTDLLVGQLSSLDTVQASSFERILRVLKIKTSEYKRARRKDKKRSISDFLKLCVSIIQSLFDYRNYRKLNRNNYQIATFQTQEEVKSIVTLAVVANGYHPEPIKRQEIAKDTIDAVVERFCRADWAEVHTLFSEGFEAAYQQLIRYEGLGGATCAAALIVDTHLYIAYLGDCRIFLVQSDNVSQISVDHTTVEEMVQQGQVTLDELIAHRVDSVIYRCLTYDQSSQPDFRLRFDRSETDEQCIANQGLKLNSGDQVLLCTRGLHKQFVTSQELEQFGDVFCSNNDPQDAVEELVTSARQNGNKGEITIIDLKVK